jgi:glycosyltransferase involved in cell wall biosynthesis
VRWYYNHSDLILAPSAYVRDEIGKWLESPVDILSRGIDIDQFSPAHRIVEEGRVRPQALYVGRVAPEKNLALLVDTFKERDNVSLKVVGDGPYLEEMKRQLPQVEFTGKLTGVQLSRAYASADFFVFPSESDTFGNVVLQAKASGLPVVVSDKMGPKEQVNHGVNGFISSDGEQFAEAVDRLVDDPGLRFRMGSAARKDAENFTWPRVFERLLQHYEHAISLNRFRPAVNH